MASVHNSECLTRKTLIDQHLRAAGWRIVPFDSTTPLQALVGCAVEEKDRPLTREHFAEFEDFYGSDPNGRSKRKDVGAEGRFRRYTLADIKPRSYDLNITWLKDDALEENGDLPELQDLATEAITELEAVVDDLREIIELLEKEEAVEK